VNPLGPTRKSYSGTDRSHGTAYSRGQTPEAEAKHPLVRLTADPASMKLAADAWQNGMWVRDVQKTSSPANRIKAAKSVNPMSVAGRKTPGQAAIMARSASPWLNERQSRTTRAGGVSKRINALIRRRVALKTARANRWPVGAGIAKAEAGWPGVGHFGRYGAASKR